MSSVWWLMLKVSGSLRPTRTDWELIICTSISFFLIFVLISFLFLSENTTLALKSGHVVFKKKNTKKFNNAKKIVDKKNNQLIKSI